MTKQPDPLREAQVAEIMSALAMFWPPPTDAADPADEWVAEAWAAREIFEGRVRAALHVTDTPAPPEGTRLVLMSEELALALGADRVEWGEPDANGWYTPTLYREDKP